MPSNQLVSNPTGDVGDVEPVRLLPGDLGVEDHLEQQVTEFLAKQFAIARLDGLDGLRRLLDQVLHQRAMGLLSVPRAALPQPGHHLDQPLQLGQRHVRESEPG